MRPPFDFHLFQFRQLASGCLLATLLALTTGCGPDGGSTAPLPPSTANAPLVADKPKPDEDSAVKSRIQVTTAVFGKLPDGREVKKYTLNNGTVEVELMEFGATILSIKAPDREGNLENVTLGFPNLEGYLQRHPYFGATVGRYANRIAFGKFKLRGKEYQLATNNGPHHLHGGKQGFDHVLWDSRLGEPEEEFASVVFNYTSSDGEEGYPGVLSTEVTYSLNTDNELAIHFMAEAGSVTIANLTNHAYFNLAGAGNGTILDHRLQINADQYLPVDKTLIPTGEIAPVEGTPLDFRSAHAVGERISQLAGDRSGYDHCFVLRKPQQEGAVPQVARLVDPKSGRTLEVLTTQPGLQLYSGNFLDGKPENGGFQQFGGLCLEAQHYPDSPNHPDFPSVVVRPPGQDGSGILQQIIVYRFGTDSTETKGNTD